MALASIMELAGTLDPLCTFKQVQTKKEAMESAAREERERAQAAAKEAQRLAAAQKAEQKRRKQQEEEKKEADRKRIVEEQRKNDAEVRAARDRANALKVQQEKLARQEQERQRALERERNIPHGWYCSGGVGVRLLPGFGGIERVQHGWGDNKFCRKDLFSENKTCGKKCEWKIKTDLKMGLSIEKQAFLLKRFLSC